MKIPTPSKILKISLFFLISIFGVLVFLPLNVEKATAADQWCAGKSPGDTCRYQGKYYGGPNYENEETCRIENRLWTCSSSLNCNKPGPVEDHGPLDNCQVCPDHGEDYDLWCENGQWKESYANGSCGTQENDLTHCPNGCGTDYEADRCQPAPEPTATPTPPERCPEACRSSNPNPDLCSREPSGDEFCELGDYAGDLCYVCEEPTSTPTPTNTPVPQGQPTPTNTPVPQSQPTPTNTPVPQGQPTPTNTPVPQSQPTPTDTPAPTDTPEPTPTPTPDFDEAMCKCDQMNVDPIALGQPINVEAFAKVEGEDTSKAEVEDMRFSIFEGDASAGRVTRIEDSTEPVNVVDNSANLVRYRSEWTSNPQVQVGETYRIMAVPNCVQKSQAFIQQEMQRTVLAERDENVGFFGQIRNFFAGIFGGGSEPEESEGVQVQEEDRGPLAFINDIFSPQQSDTERDQLQLDTFQPAQMEKEACNIVKFRFDAL